MERREIVVVLLNNITVSGDIDAGSMLQDENSSIKEVIKMLLRARISKITILAIRI